MHAQRATLWPHHLPPTFHSIRSFKPFVPEYQPEAWRQIFNGAAIAFYSYIGFDAVATAAEEVYEPKKNMPKVRWGMLGI